MGQTGEQETIDYILRFSIYQEPLHILIGALVEKNLFGDERSFSTLMLGLIKDGYLQVEKQSEDGYQWLIQKDLTEKELTAYMVEREKEHHEKYPEAEYYVRTTNLGLQYLRESKVE